jgi:hypothetical protein
VWLSLFQDLYNSRPLPHVIGTRSFLEDDTLGLNLPLDVGSYHAMPSSNFMVAVILLDSFILLPISDALVNQMNHRAKKKANPARKSRVKKSLTRMTRTIRTTQMTLMTRMLRSSVQVALLLALQFPHLGLRYDCATCRLQECFCVCCFFVVSRFLMFLFRSDSSH